jgi:Uma2 family endonuclease
MAIGDDSEPEPDLCVVQGSARDYEGEHPNTAALVLEVADTTLSMDRRVKASLYASAGIPDYWILNLRDRVLEVQRDPEAAAGAAFGFRYRTTLRFDEGASVTPLRAPGHAIAVADLLPRAR